MKRLMVMTGLVLMTAVGCSYATDGSDGGVDSGLPLVPVARIEVNSRRYGDLPGLANADYVAMRDGQGPWQVVEGVGGTYTLPVTDGAGKFSAFVVCPGQPSNREAVLIQATLGEMPLTPVPCLQSVDLDGGLIVDANATVVVKVNYNFQQIFDVSGSVGGAASFVAGDGVSWTNGNDQVPTGFYDLIAYGTNQSGVLVSGWVAHHQRVENVTQFSFDLVTAPAVQTAQVSVNPAVANIQLLTHQSFLSSLYSDPVRLTAATLDRVALFPATLLDSGDYQGVLTHYADSPSNIRGHLKLAKIATDYSLALPATLTPNLTSQPGASVVMLSYQWSGGPANAGLAVLASQPNFMSLCWISPASLSSATSWTGPDLSQVPGWDSSWGLARGVVAQWTVINLGGSTVGWRQGVRMLPFNLGGFTEAADIDYVQAAGTLTP